MTPENSENQKPRIDFSQAKEPPRSINPNQPDTGPIIDSEEVSKDDNLKLPDELDNEQDNNIAGSQVVKANLSAG
jgi:hypothetical protein